VNPAETAEWQVDRGYGIDAWKHRMIARVANFW
jgi:hypothetical protein